MTEREVWKDFNSCNSKVGTRRHGVINVQVKTLEIYIFCEQEPLITYIVETEQRQCQLKLGSC